MFKFMEKQKLLTATDSHSIKTNANASKVHNHEATDWKSRTWALLYFK